MTTAQKIIEARKTLGIKTQAEFARALGVGRNTVHDWESGKYGPRPLMAKRIGKLIGCEWYELIGEPTKKRRTA